MSLHDEHLAAMGDERARRLHADLERQVLSLQNELQDVREENLRLKQAESQQQQATAAVHMRWARRR
jgi:hypothetical protein